MKLHCWSYWGSFKAVQLLFRSDGGEVRGYRSCRKTVHWLADYVQQQIRCMPGKNDVSIIKKKDKKNLYLDNTVDLDS